MNRTQTKLHRKAMGLSLRTAAKELGMSFVWLSLWERGKLEARKPSTVKKLQKYSNNLAKRFRAWAWKNLK